MSIFDDAVKVERFVFDWQKVAVSRCVSMKGLRRNARLNFDDSDAAYLVAELTSYCLANHNEVRQVVVEFKAPASAWQHFKRDHLPVWLQRWFAPVRYQTHRESREIVVLTLLCPHLDVEARGPHVEFLVHGGNVLEETL